MTIYLAQVIGSKDDVIATAFTYPNMHPKKKPTQDVAAKAILHAVEAAVTKFMDGELRDAVQDTYEMYVLTNGERSDSEDPDEWDSGIDDAVEVLLEPYQEHLSASWLGTHTINTRLDEEGGIDRFLSSLGKEVFKELSYGKTPNQTLTNAGIVTEDIAAALADHTAQEAPEMMNDPTINADLSDVLQTIYNRLGEGFDPVAVYDDLGMIVGTGPSDEPDDLLAAGAAGRLGIDENGIFTLQMAALDLDEDDKADALCTMLGEFKAPVKPKREKGSGRAGVGVEGAKPFPSDLLALVKNHSAVSDSDMSKALGISRTTYTNFITGKNELTLVDDQVAVLRAQIEADIAGLARALEMLPAEAE